MDMTTTARKLPHSLDTQKETKKKKNNEEERSKPEKKKMGQEIEEIFRANKKKRNESPGVAGQSSTKARLEYEKTDKKVNKKKTTKEKKKNTFPVDENSKNHSKRRKTADGFAIYSAEELGLGNEEAGNTPLCPFDCSCCF